MKKVKSLLTATILIAVMSLPSFAADEPFSISVNGKMLGNSQENQNIMKVIASPEFEGEAAIRPMGSSFITYGKYVGNVRVSNKRYDNYNKQFFYTSFNIPSGTEYEYEFKCEVESTVGTVWDVGGHIRAQGGVKFIAELEGQINGNYQSSETITYRVGLVQKLKATSAGFYEARWYHISEKFDLYADWEAWTVDAPNTKKIVSRYLGYGEGATPYEHVELTRKY